MSERHLIASVQLLDGSVVVDRDGHAWTLIRDGGMFTRADYAGIKTAGVAWLEAHAGPLRTIYRKETRA